MTTYRLVNQAWQLGHDALLLRREAAGCDVLAVVEARTGDNRPIDVQAILGNEWDVVQDTSTAAKSGSALAVRIDSPVRIRRWTMARASRRGRDVQDRYRVSATLVDRSRPVGRRLVRVGVQHNPIASNHRQPEAVESAARWVKRAQRWRRITRGRWALLGDFNLEPSTMQNRTNAWRSWGVRPMGVLLSKGWDIDTRTHVSPGSDHKILTMKEK